MSDKVPTAPSPLEVVLDTNVVLDWLLFVDPAIRPIADAIESGTWRWIGTVETLRELATVLLRPEFERWRPRAEDRSAQSTAVVPSADWPNTASPLATHHPAHPVLARAQRLCHCVPVPVVGGVLALACTDADDQKFIDLALGRRARWLFSRDKALLRLARRARPFGVTVLRPVDCVAT